MRNTFFTFLVLFLSGCSVLKTEQARTDEVSSRSASRFLDNLRNVHGKVIVITCYKGPNLFKLKQDQNRIKLPGWGSIFGFLGKIVDKRIVLQEVSMVMGPTGDLTGVRFRQYSGMVDRMKYLEDIDVNSAFYAYMEPHPSIKGMGYPRIAIVRIVNRGIKIIKVDENKWPNKPEQYDYNKRIQMPIDNPYWKNRESNLTYHHVFVRDMLRLTKQHLLSLMYQLDPNVDPDWNLLYKSNFYQAMFNDNDMPHFYSNF